jgi:uncharacterized protein YecT (DUF1311 family)
MIRRLLVVFACCFCTPWSLSQSAKGMQKQASPVSPSNNVAPSKRESYCDDGGTLGQVQCLTAFNRQLDAEMNVIYQKALARLPDRDEQDSRKQREQLRRSQRAWVPYMRENCTLIGGQEGGSNLWVSYFAAMCEERELRQRIQFLEGIAGAESKP